MLVAGVDCSTQSTKVVLCEATDGAVVAQGSAPHPDGTECDPQAWWDALHRAGNGLIDRAAAIAVARSARPKTG
jgi:xylulokinase